MSILALLLAVCLLVVVHEYGHYRVAVACGVKVLRFSVGFGPVLWRYQRTPQSTEWVISAIPLGGYVRMLGQGEGPVAQAEQAVAFDFKPLWQRTAIVAAGPLANLALAVLLYAVCNWVGVQEPRARLATPASHSLAQQAGLRGGDVVKSVSDDEGAHWQDVRSLPDLRWHVINTALRAQPLQLVVTDGAGRGQREVVLPLQKLALKEVDAQAIAQMGMGSPFRLPKIREVIAGGAAAQAGLRLDDLVLSIDEVPVVDADQLLQRIETHLDERQPMAWLIERAGQRLQVTVQPMVEQEQGGTRKGRIRAFIGGPPEVVTVSYGGWEGLSQALARTWDMSGLTFKMLGRMLIGQASIKQISGPVTMADYAGQSARLGWAAYLGFLAAVSISLGVFNLLPVPVLDGGHLMYHLFEALTKRKLSALWLERLSRGGLAIVLLLMSLAFYNDLAHYLGR